MTTNDALRLGRGAMRATQFNAPVVGRRTKTRIAVRLLQQENRRRRIRNQLMECRELGHRGVQGQLDSLVHGFWEHQTHTPKRAHGFNSYWYGCKPMLLER